MTKTGISTIERGDTKQPKNLVQIAKALGINPTYLATDEWEDSSPPDEQFEVQAAPEPQQQAPMANDTWPFSRATLAALQRLRPSRSEKDRLELLLMHTFSEIEEDRRRESDEIRDSHRRSTG